MRGAASACPVAAASLRGGDALGRLDHAHVAARCGGIDKID
jgi:hypothetical protein